MAKLPKNKRLRVTCIHGNDPICGVIDDKVQEALRITILSNGTALSEQITLTNLRRLEADYERVDATFNEGPDGRLAFFILVEAMRSFFRGGRQDKIQP